MSDKEKQNEKEQQSDNATNQTAANNSETIAKSNGGQATKVTDNASDIDTEQAEPPSDLPAGGS